MDICAFVFGQRIELNLWWQMIQLLHFFFHTHFMFFYQNTKIIEVFFFSSIPK